MYEFVLQQTTKKCLYLIQQKVYNLRKNIIYAFTLRPKERRCKMTFGKLKLICPAVWLRHKNNLVQKLTKKLKETQTQVTATNTITTCRTLLLKETLTY